MATQTPQGSSPNTMAPAGPVAPKSLSETLSKIHAQVAADNGAPPPAAPITGDAPVPVTPAPQPSTFVPTTETILDFDLPIDAPIAPANPTAPTAEEPTEPTSTADKILEAAEGKEPKKDKDENFKKIRESLKSTKEELSAKDNELKELARKVEQYESGEVLPEPVQQLQERVKELEQYEKLHALRLSPEYEAKYAAPLEEALTKARTFAEEYDIDPNVLDAARGMENKKERNKLLRKHLDEVAALEAINILDDLTSLETEIEAAEAQPAMSFEQLRQERVVQQREEEQNRVSRIQTNAKEAWIDALDELRGSGEYPEVTLTGDQAIDAHVRPVLEAASGEFGKLIRALGAQKVQDLPKDAAKVLAKWAIMANAASLMASSRAAHYRSSKDILESNKKHNPMLRPQIGQSSGFSGTPNGADPSAPKVSAQNAAAALREKVLSS